MPEIGFDFGYSDFLVIFDWIEPILLASKELKSCCVKKAMDK